MIGDVNEIICKENLAEAMGKMKRNIAGVGSLEALKEKYPDGYKKLRDKIRGLTGQYVEAALSGVQYSTEIPAEEISRMWADAKPLIRKAMNENDADLVQKSISDFIGEVLLKYREGRSSVRYEFPDEVA